jgi:hypothetical protein
MIITRMSLPRRTFLRGIGATIALPILDAMVPALAAQTKTSAKPVQRLAAIYIPNGAVMDRWTPAGEGTKLEMSSSLKPLEVFRDQLVVVSGLGSRPADSWGEGNGDHARACASWLNQEHIQRSESDLRAGTTIDQIAAGELGRDTALRSIELGIEDFRIMGGCDNGYACSYHNALSWRTPTTPLLSEPNPRTIFERLFGEGGSPIVRRAQLEKNRSILDSVLGEVERLKVKLGVRDQQKMSEYLDSLRELEDRIRKIEAQSDEAFLAAPEAPVGGAPDTFEDHAKLMFDLQVAAFTGDITRVSTFLLARELSGRAYPNIGVLEAHHGLSHHGNDPDKIEKLAKINAYHVQLLAYFLGKLRDTPDGDGSLLDHIVVLYGGGMSNGNLHNHINLPTVLAGGATGQLQGGRHLRYKEGTPMANLLVSLLDMVGVSSTGTIGDSTGALTGL